jgi:hypothetical protein
VATHETFVATLYQGLLGRPAEKAGLAFWAGRLHAGATREQVAAGFLGSEEYRTRQVCDLYQALLYRPPEAAGLEYWLTRLRGGTLTPVKAGVLGSDEYFAAAGGTPEQFLSALYRAALRRPPDDGGRACWGARLRAGVTREAVAAGVLAGPDALQAQVTFFYRGILGRELDAVGAGYWVAVLRQGTPPEAVLAALLGSEEFLDHLQRYVPYSSFSDPNWAANLFLHGAAEDSVECRVPSECTDLPAGRPRVSFAAGTPAVAVSVGPTGGSAEPFLGAPVSEREPAPARRTTARLRERIKAAYALVCAGLPWSASRFARPADLPDGDGLVVGGFKLGGGW